MPRKFPRWMPKATQNKLEQLLFFGDAIDHGDRIVIVKGEWKEAKAAHDVWQVTRDMQRKFTRPFEGIFNELVNAGYARDLGNVIIIDVRKD